MKSLPLLLSFLIAGAGLAAASNDPVVVPLWDGAPPGSKDDASYVEKEFLSEWEPRVALINQVSKPRVEVYLPAAGKATGAAVVICPGGGYGVLAHIHEGRKFARWFQERGVAGVVLYYRLPSDRIMEDKRIGPLQDVQQALRLVRRHASEWQVSPDKVGVMGFSAGGHLAGTASTLYRDKVYPVSDDVSARPSFSILAYGVLSFQESMTHGGSLNNLLGASPSKVDRDHFSNELQVDAQTPPAFLVHAADDGAVPEQNSWLYYQALRRFGIPAELHVYEVGGHGFGTGGPCPQWMDELGEWMRRHGWAVKP